MANLLRNIAVVTVLAAALAACGGEDKAPTPPVVVTPPAAKLEDGFGTNFGTAYRADPNTEAKDPAPGDLVPLSLTTDPTTI